MTPEPKIIKRKLAVLTDITGKGKMQSLNYALDVALASSRCGINFEQIVMHERKNKTKIHQSVMNQYLRMLLFENAYRKLINWRNGK